MDACPWGTNELKRLGVHIRDETPPGSDHPSYGEVMAWYNDLAASVQRRISGLDWPPLLRERPFEVTSRAKTIDTLRQKLRRHPTYKLPTVQDIAGVRFEAEMSLDEQDAVVNAICGVYDHDISTCVQDMRDEPHSGYRAVHIWLRLPQRVEVQVRTHLQGEWANMYEAAADVFGRGIRYDELPEDEGRREVVEALRELSTVRISSIEWNRNEAASIDLRLEDDARRGIRTVSEEDRLRLDQLKSRGLRDEQSLQQSIAKLREFFIGVREGRGS
ncbi:MAG: hypothetical protein QM611_08725 [Microbacterium sp.]|uniref:hypothetical protein n=1 Tax=Microbacterium sp. TaxID=51671 RepID=UPI0039E4762F